MQNRTIYLSRNIRTYTSATKKKEQRPGIQLIIYGIKRKTCIKSYTCVDIALNIPTTTHINNYHSNIATFHARLNGQEIIRNCLTGNYLGIPLDLDS